MRLSAPAETTAAAVVEGSESPGGQSQVVVVAAAAIATSNSESGSRVAEDRNCSLLLSLWFHLILTVPYFTLPDLLACLLALLPLPTDLPIYLPALPLSATLQSSHTGH